LQKVSQKKFLDELKATATLQPSDPEAGFNIWNALTFWIGVLLEVVSMLFGGNPIVATVGLLGHYSIAYLLYWAVIKSQSKWYILRAFLFALCLAVFYGFSAVGGLILIFPAVLYGTKAASTAIMCIHVWAVYKKSPDQEKPFRLQVELM